MFALYTTKMKKIILLLCIFQFSLTYSQTSHQAASKTTINHISHDSISSINHPSCIIKGLEIPQTHQYELIISHLGYTLSFNKAHKQANWVAYELTKEETIKGCKRTNKFIPDPLIANLTANNEDYAKSGFDRGHLAPAADMSWSQQAMDESFYYSNMSPQTPKFNRGKWKQLEELTRDWANEYNSLYIITGPILNPHLTSIGTNSVSVPNYFYKIILDYTKPDIKGIGFIMPNTNLTEPLEHYSVSIDSVEKMTHLDFFPLLPNEQEELIEHTHCITCWLWEKQTEKSTLHPKDIQLSEQCKALTKKGTRCENKSIDKKGYCGTHKKQTKK